MRHAGRVPCREDAARDMSYLLLVLCEGLEDLHEERITRSAQHRKESTRVLRV